MFRSWRWVFALALAACLQVASRPAAVAGGFHITTMGGSRTSMTAILARPDDGTALFHNPAGLADQRGVRAHLSVGLPLMRMEQRLMALDAGRFPAINPEGCQQLPGGCPWPVDSEGYYERAITPERIFGLLPFASVSTDLSFLWPARQDMGAALSYKNMSLSMSQKMSTVNTLTPHGEQPSALADMGQQALGDLRMDFEGHDHGPAWKWSTCVEHGSGRSDHDPRGTGGDRGAALRAIHARPERETAPRGAAGPRRAGCQPGAAGLHGAGQRQDPEAGHQVAALRGAIALSPGPCNAQRPVREGIYHNGGQTVTGRGPVPPAEVIDVQVHPRG